MSEEYQQQTESHTDSETVVFDSQLYRRLANYSLVNSLFSTTTKYYQQVKAKNSFFKSLSERAESGIKTFSEPVLRKLSDYDLEKHGCRALDTIENVASVADEKIKATANTGYQIVTYPIHLAQNLTIKTVETGKNIKSKTFETVDNVIHQGLDLFEFGVDYLLPEEEKDAHYTCENPSQTEETPAEVEMFILGEEQHTIPRVKDLTLKVQSRLSKHLNQKLSYLTMRTQKLPYVVDLIEYANEHIDVQKAVDYGTKKTTALQNNLSHVTELYRNKKDYFMEVSYASLVTALDVIFSSAQVSAETVKSYYAAVIQTVNFGELSSEVRRLVADQCKSLYSIVGLLVESTDAYVTSNLIKNLVTKMLSLLRSFGFNFITDHPNEESRNSEFYEEN